MILKALMAGWLVVAGADVHEIARGHSWVSPYWGYSAPKIVFDGTAYYTCGLWGDSPEKAEAVVYKFEKGAWRAGAHFPGLYQPAMLLLDAQGRLLVVYNRQNAPMVLLRGTTSGNVDAFEPLPSPPDHDTGYYLGAGIWGDRLHFAWLVTPSYTMYRAALDLSTGTWSTPAVVQEGQAETKPKTAWTYPLLWPDDKGLHLVASNAPDGGEGNTYNEVWYLYFPNDTAEPAVRERVAQCPVGHFAFAMDLRVDAEGPQILLMYNVRKYGDPLPEDTQPEGTYRARRDRDGKWILTRVGANSIAGFGDTNAVVLQEAGAVVARSAEGASQTLGAADKMPVWPSFMDVLSPASGSRPAPGPAVVMDGILDNTRVLWSVLPAP